MDNYSGEKFLIELYKDLYMSDEVQHISEKTDKKYEAVKKYLERLENIHSKANTKTKKDLLKSLYYDKYVIKEETLRNNTNAHINENEINQIIINQKKSLDKWLDYLSDAATDYPLWAKYWAFQGMLKMGNYDEGIEGYQKRSKDTETPFVDANPEIIAKAIEMANEKLKEKDKYTKKDLDKLVSELKFSKVYAILEKKYKDNIIEYSGTEGVWIKYNQGSREDAIKLCNTLQNKNTHWCTAEESMAIKQVCGAYGDAPNGGDFYVYYTKDKKGEYTLPRIAMRMIDHDKIGEIRGILEGQNLEESMDPILESKLNEMTFLDDKSKENAFKKINGLKKLTEIYKKTVQKELLTDEEINDLYSKTYGFGWDNDPKVDKIIDKRDLLKDFNSVKDNFLLKTNIYQRMINKKDENIKITDEEYVKYCIERVYNIGVLEHFDPKSSKDYQKLANYAVDKSPVAIRYIDPDYISNYEELANKVLKKNDYFINFIKPEKISNYEELANKVVKTNPHMISLIKPEYVSNYNELLEIAIKNDPSSLRTANPKYIPNYEELLEKTIDFDPECVLYIKKDYVSNYDKLLEKALLRDPKIIMSFNKYNTSNYDKLARIVIDKSPFNISYVNHNHVSNYNELANIAFAKDKQSIYYINPEHTKDYNKMAIRAIKVNPLYIIGINPVYVSDYEKLVKNVLKDKSAIKKLLEKEFPINFAKIYYRHEFIKTILQINGLYIKYIDKDEDSYELYARLAVKQNPEALKFIDKENISNMEELQELSKKEKSLSLKLNKKNNNTLGFIDILSITILVLSFGFMLLIILNIFNK